MAERLFGTDGVRGEVNTHPMTADMALRLGLAVGARFANNGRRHRVVIGKDTRLSGYIFEYALTSGLCAMGMDVYLVGPLPTPAVSFLTRSMRADVGIVISASHNPFYDNGIKFFDAQGFKLPDEVENEIAAMVLDAGWKWNYPAADRVGRAAKIDDAPGRYIVFTKSSFPAHLNLNGMRVVLDCANGANYKVAPLALEELGAEVVKMGVDPDGININRDCGSLYPDKVAAKVRELRADVGLALDGDADRLIVVDEQGAILDGDQLMALCVAEMMANGKLPGNKLVATVMSNLALEVFMRERGGILLRTPVGDRYVVEEMLKVGAMFGGEQSGHLIFREYSTTGDGLLAALQILRVMREKEKPLSELAGQLTLYPQTMLNIRVAKKPPFDQCPDILAAKEKMEQELAGRGRVLLRYSGTEPLCRVMVEGEKSEEVRRYAEDLADVVQRSLQ